MIDAKTNFVWTSKIKCQNISSALKIHIPFKRFNDQKGVNVCWWT